MENEIKKLNEAIETIRNCCEKQDRCDNCLIGRNNGICKLTEISPNAWEPIKPEPILTQEEHDYLKTVISQADRKIISICKLYNANRENIDIETEGGENILLFPFDRGTKFIGMKRECDYTPKELGL